MTKRSLLSHGLCKLTTVFSYPNYLSAAYFRPNLLHQSIYQMDWCYPVAFTLNWHQTFFFHRWLSSMTQFWNEWNWLYTESSNISKFQVNPWDYQKRKQTKSQNPFFQFIGPQNCLRKIYSKWFFDWLLDNIRKWWSLFWNAK